MDCPSIPPGDETQNKSEIISSAYENIPNVQMNLTNSESDLETIQPTVDEKLHSAHLKDSLHSSLINIKE